MPTGPPAIVTGISPKDGVPGIKLTLRGENFGQSSADLTHVFIGGIDVSPSARWFSPRKLLVITPLGVGELEIVVVTKSGGIGMTELFYTQSVGQKIGAQEQVSYWPEDERRRCPAIIERGSTAEGGGGAVTDSSLLCSITGIPLAELANFGIPLSDTQLISMYPSSGSVHLTETDFDPMLFLLKFYKNASYEDLLLTLNNFRQSIFASGDHDSISVIKNNLFLIFRCLEGMEALNTKIAAESSLEKGKLRENSLSSSVKGSVEVRLEKSLTDSRNLGFSLFEEVLRCRGESDSARNILGILQRFHFLFNLPEVIRANMEKGDYNLAITDYQRAKSLFCSSDVEAFHRVYSEVELVMDRFRKSLKSELLQMPIDVEDAGKKIRCLQQLDLDYDPGWLCLEAFKTWLVDQLNTYRRNYKDSCQASSATDSRSSGVSERYSRGKKALAIQLVQKVCALLSTNFVQFWRLQSTYLTPSRRPVYKAGDQLVSSLSSAKERTHALNVELIHLSASCIREVVLEPEMGVNSDLVSSGWASSCIQEFRNCCSNLPLSVVPDDAQGVLRRLSRDLRRHAVREVFRNSQAAIESLHFKEPWTIQTTDEGGCITNLPCGYESMIFESLCRCRNLTSPRTALESSLFDSAEYQEQFLQSFAKTMTSFLSTLQHLADQIEASLPPKDTKGVSASCDGVVDDKYSKKIEVVSQSRGLLLLVTNSDWSARYINTRVFHAYASANYPSVEVLRKTVTESWMASTSALIDRYISLRSCWLCAPVLHAIRELPSDRMKLGFRGAVLSALCNMSHVHSELVLLLGLPSETFNSVPEAVDAVTPPDETTSPCFHRMAPIIRKIASNLLDCISHPAEVAASDEVDEQVNFVKLLLRNLLNGDSLEQLMISKSVPALEEVKQSIRLVSSALSARRREKSFSASDVPSQSSTRTVPLGSQRRIAHPSRRLQ